MVTPRTSAAKTAARKSPAKPAATTPAKTPAKAPAGKGPAAKVVAKPVAAPAPVAPAEKLEKPKKPKLVRDSFTIPKLEYAVIDELKLRSTKLGRNIKKSELLRAGLKAIAAMADAELQKALQAVPAIKTGRPKG
jgi:hypothetical protein